jgi:hypothetical protein
MPPKINKINITVSENDVISEGFWKIDNVTDNGRHAKRLSNTLVHLGGGSTTVLAYGLPDKKGNVHLYRIDVKGRGSRGRHYNDNVSLAVELLRNLSIKNREDPLLPLCQDGNNIVGVSPKAYHKLKPLFDEIDSLL